MITVNNLKSLYKNLLCFIIGEIWQSSWGESEKAEHKKLETVDRSEMSPEDRNRKELTERLDESIAAKKINTQRVSSLASSIAKDPDINNPKLSSLAKLIANNPNLNRQQLLDLAGIIENDPNIKKIDELISTTDTLKYYQKELLEAHVATSEYEEALKVVKDNSEATWWEVMDFDNKNLGDLINKIFWITWVEWWTPIEWFDWVNVEPSLKEFAETALSQMWTSETDWWADIYLKELWYKNLNSRNTPWCAAFINWSLKQCWFEGTGWLAAKWFIEGSWSGHVWIKFWDKVLWWNQWDKVSMMSINKPIIWYAIPSKEWLDIHKPAWDISKIPDWAIIVFDRSEGKDKNMA